MVSERHRHRYEFNSRYRARLEAAGLRCSGTSPDGRLVEFIEFPGHPFWVGTQAHPEFKSRPDRPHPLVPRAGRRRRSSAPRAASRTSSSSTSAERGGPVTRRATGVGSPRSSETPGGGAAASRWTVGPLPRPRRRGVRARVHPTSRRGRGDRRRRCGPGDPGAPVPGARSGPGRPRDARRDLRRRRGSREKTRPGASWPRRPGWRPARLERLGRPAGVARGAPTSSPPSSSPPGSRRARPTARAPRSAAMTVERVGARPRWSRWRRPGELIDAPTLAGGRARPRGARRGGARDARARRAAATTPRSSCPGWPSSGAGPSSRSRAYRRDLAAYESIAGRAGAQTVANAAIARRRGAPGRAARERARAGLDRAGPVGAARAAPVPGRGGAAPTRTRPPRSTGPGCPAGCPRP